MDAARNHLIVTRDLVLKGTIDPVLGRLSDHLRNYGRTMLTMFDAGATWLSDGSRQDVPEMSVAIGQVLFAHEYVDMSSDPHLKAVNASGDGERYRIVMKDIPGLIVIGSLRRRPEGKDGFLVLTTPEVRDLDETASGIADVLRGLDYLLVNENLIEAYYGV